MGIRPEQFLSERERTDFLEAAATEQRHRSEVDRLHELERRSRWQGEALSADDVRHIASVQQSLTEMGRGERFVVDYLRARARARERWYVALPLAVLGLLGLAAMAFVPSVAFQNSASFLRRARLQTSEPKPDSN